MIKRLRKKRSANDPSPDASMARKVIAPLLSMDKRRMDEGEAMRWEKKVRAVLGARMTVAKLFPEKPIVIWNTNGKPIFWDFVQKGVAQKELRVRLKRDPVTDCFGLLSVTITKHRRLTDQIKQCKKVAAKGGLLLGPLALKNQVVCYVYPRLGLSCRKGGRTAYIDLSDKTVVDSGRLRETHSSARNRKASDNSGAETATMRGTKVQAIPKAHLSATRVSTASIGRQSSPIGGIQASVVELSVPYTSQGDGNFCAPTSVKMICDYYSDLKTMDRLRCTIGEWRKTLKTDRDAGTKLNDLEDGLHQFLGIANSGVDFSAGTVDDLDVTFDQIRACLDNQDPVLNGIVLHVRVIAGYRISASLREFKILDPALGESWETFDADALSRFRYLELFRHA